MNNFLKTATGYDVVLTTHDVIVCKNTEKGLLCELGTDAYELNKWPPVNTYTFFHLGASLDRVYFAETFEIKVQTLTKDLV